MGGNFPDPLVVALRARAAVCGAHCLGGVRAFEQYTEEKFVETPTTKSARAAATTFDPAKHNLFLCGPTGTGKSHLAAVAARRRFERPGWEDAVRTVTPMEVSRAIRAADHAGREKEVLDDYVKRPVLILEDLGAEKGTEFLISALYEVVNGRYQNRPGGLIVTSNLTLGELAQKFGDDRISSRLAQMCLVFNLSGERDHRLSMI